MSKASKSTRHRLTMAVSALALGVAIGLSPGLAPLPASPAHAQSAQTPPATPVEATAAVTRDLPLTLDAVGTVKALKEAPVQAVKSDRIVQVLAKDAQWVKQGDLLFKLDDTAEKAKVAAAQSALSVAQKALERTQQLTKSGAAARSKLPEAEADVEKATSDLDAAQVDLDHTLVNAPFDGILGILKVEEGDYAAPGAELVTIYAMPPLTVMFDIPQRHLSKLKGDEPVAIWTTAFPDHRHEGKVAVISPAVNTDTRAVEVKAEIPDGGKLRPGMFVSVQVTVDTIKGAVLVPEAALVPTSKGILVYTVVDGKAKANIVTPGQRVDGLVQIPEGIAGGDMVITSGQQKIGPGSPVSVPKPAADAGTGAGTGDAAKPAGGKG